MKRAIDIAVSAIAMVALLPVLAILAVVIRIGLGSPILFRQDRIGHNGAVFRITKFRTMTDARDAEGRLLPDAERLTSLGLRLRSWSLDELPELLDVLRGDMSLVGPRPLPVRYRDRYSPAEWRRHECKPGITGWAQINGRNALSWPEKFALDVWYVDNRSLALDVKILFLTLKAVLTRRGITSDEHATMPEFLGRQTPDD
ncbi:MAG: sugar transferase [Acidimicrobiia bacterium]|nr:sugar transferase [Acidimicrobiia bacterium]